MNILNSLAKQLKYAKILEFGKALKRNNLSSIAAQVIKQALKVKKMTYIIKELSHHLNFINIFKTSFKYHLMTINQQSFNFQYNDKSSYTRL